ncbi:hypothetical protein [uncultured Leifsonia sp.]|uniref:hypothetical protein n=1 Tax=uncultured Leifsonia sp. TaxID=340359 RepID=UPI0025CB9789|nr:hypothetical protein [uncultured Leifsonia sp.]
MAADARTVAAHRPNGPGVAGAISSSDRHIVGSASGMMSPGSRRVVVAAGSWPKSSEYSSPGHSAEAGAAETRSDHVPGECVTVSSSSTSVPCCVNVALPTGCPEGSVNDAVPMVPLGVGRLSLGTLWLGVGVVVGVGAGVVAVHAVAPRRSEPASAALASRRAIVPLRRRTVVSVASARVVPQSPADLDNLAPCPPRFVSR